MSETTECAEHLMAERNVRPTANRITILRQLQRAPRPLSMAELETQLQTVDKSVLSRTLSLFADAHLVHVIDDGSGSAKYEACSSGADHSADDMHPHFHCYRCGATHCLDSVAVPSVELPQGYRALSVNYVIKGECAECAAKSDC